MKKYNWLIILTLVVTSCYQGQSADLIIHNAKIYSCDKNFTIYEAMAIKDGKILQLGPEREILNGYDCDHIINAELKPVYPGFYDAHCHFLSYAKTLGEVNLVGSKSFEEVVNRIKSFDEINNTEWIQGRGWDQTLWLEDSIFPTNEVLNEQFPNTPLLIRRIDGHAALANEKALALAGFDLTSSIDGGVLEVIDGKLTGILIDNAIDSMQVIIPDWEKEVKIQYLKKAEQNLFEQGLTTINDAGVYYEDRDLFIELYENKELSINMYLMLFPVGDNLDFASKNGIYNEGRLHIGSFKLISDGALGSWGDCLNDVYSDSPHEHGYLLQNEKEMHDIASFAKEINYQLNTHCIGDSANSVMLRIYQDIIADKFDHRWKIEHVQVLRPSDFEYFKTLGVIPSVQPTHCNSDMRWAEKRLGSERGKFAYAYNDILEKAGLIALGTDFPIENISVMETFYAVVARKDKEGLPLDSFQIENALSRKDALMGITYWAAYSNFEEKRRGSLEANKNADFVFLSKDIMEVKESELLNTFVLNTFINGVEVFTAY
jgi:predicted amidohydrolase YtcJ